MKLSVGVGVGVGVLIVGVVDERCSPMSFTMCLYHLCS